MADRMEELANEVLQDFADLSEQRGQFESHWEEIADYLWPNYRNTFYPNSSNTAGERKTDRQLDSTPQIALDRFGAILDSLLTPRNQKWHQVQPSDATLLRDRQVQLYFEDLNNLLFRYRYAPEANFASQNQLLYKGLGAFGSSAMFIDALSTGPGLRYKAISIAEQYWRENHQGVVDTVLRRFSLRARQALQIKGWQGKLPDQITTVGNDPKRKDQEFWFLHRVRPRAEIMKGALDSRSMPFESVYVSEMGKKVLEEGGFRAFPYAPTRYEQAPNETYGRSPAMQALPAIKTLMVQKRVVLTQGHRAVNPVLLVADDGIMDNVNLRPGAQVFGAVTQEGRALVQPLPTGDVLLGKDMMDDERAVINDAFLVSIFQVLLESTNRKTATEVLEIARDRGMIVAPTAGRQQSEYLGPLIQREIDVLTNQNLLPPFPPALVEAQGEYTIQYTSPLSRMARAEEASGFMRVLETATAVAQATGDPAPLRRFNFDRAIVGMSDIQAVPASWLHSDEEMAQLAQLAAQQAQQQAQIAAAPGQAALLKAAADAKAKGLKSEDLQ